MNSLHSTGSPTHRQTKIVATIGPACGTVERLTEMIRAGMNVARLNLSHGTLPAHKEQIRLLREASQQARTSIAIMIDTRGIEIRTGLIKTGTVELMSGASFTLYTDVREGDADGVGVT